MDYEKEMPFGAFDSELMHQEINIPEGFEATIEGNKIILTRILSEDERIRKRLIDFFEDWHENRSHCWGIAVSKILTWLEKQDSQIPANSAKTCKDEQKPIKWDEYDEMYVAALITIVKNHCTTDDKLKNELIGWLVSLNTIIK